MSAVSHVGPAADPDMILQACVFEIVSTQVEQVAVPDWAFAALGQPVGNRNFRYADMIYPEGHRRNWGPNASVPDVSCTEAKLWFLFQATSYLDLGCERITRRGAPERPSFQPATAGLPGW